MPSAAAPKRSTYAPLDESVEAHSTDPAQDASVQVRLLPRPLRFTRTMGSALYGLARHPAHTGQIAAAWELRKDGRTQTKVGTIDLLTVSTNNEERINYSMARVKCRLARALAWGIDGIAVGSKVAGLPAVQVLDALHLQTAQVEVWSHRFAGRSTSTVNALAWQPHGHRLLVGLDDGSVHVLQQGEQIQSFRQHVGGVCGVAWSQDDWLATVSQDRSLCILDAADESRGSGWMTRSHGLADTRVDSVSSHNWIVQEHAHRQAINAVEFCPGKPGWLATVSQDQAATLWAVVEKGVEKLWTKEFESEIQSLAFNPSGTQLALGMYERGDAVVIDSVTGGEIWTLHRLCIAEHMAHIVWTGEHSMIAGDLSGHIYYAEIPTMTPTTQMLGGHAQWSATATTEKLLRTSTTTELMAWRSAQAQQIPPAVGAALSTQEDICLNPLHRDTVRSVGWSSDGQQVATGSIDGTVQVVSSKTLRAHQVDVGVGIYCVAWQPKEQSSRLALAGEKGILKVVDVASHITINATGAHEATTVHAVAWHPDGMLLASGDYTGTICVWDVTESELSQRLAIAVNSIHSKCVLCLAWSPDGCRFVSGSSDTDVCLFDFDRYDASQSLVLSECVQRVDSLHTAAVNSVAWNASKHREWIVTGSNDGSARIVDVGDGCRVLRTFKNELLCGRVLSVSWSRDGKRLALGTLESTVCIITTASTAPDRWRVIWKISHSNMNIAKRANVHSVTFAPNSTHLGVGSSHPSACIVDTFQPFEQLLAILLCCRRETEWTNTVANLIKCVSRTSWVAALLTQSTREHSRQAELLIPSGWTVFHELASAAEEAREELWSLSERLSELDGTYVPVRQGVTTVSLKEAGVHVSIPDALMKKQKVASVSAVDICILQKDPKGVKFLFSKLDHDMPIGYTGNLVHSLILLAELLPQRIVWSLDQLKASGGIRQQRSIQHLCTIFDTEAGLLVRSSNGSTDDSNRLWNGPDDRRWWPWCGIRKHSIEYEKREQEDNGEEFHCVQELIAMKNFVGTYRDDITSSPYHMLVNRCPKSKVQEHAFYKSPLIIAATEFKWRTFVRVRVVKRLWKHILHFTVVAMALLISTQQMSLRGDDRLESFERWELIFENNRASQWWYSTIAHVFMFLSNSVLLRKEISEYRRKGSVCRYIESNWNKAELSAILVLYSASASYLFDRQGGVRILGALGALLSGVSVLKHCQAFSLTGKLIRMIGEIIADMKGFVCIALVLWVSYTVAFTVAMPHSIVFDPYLLRWLAPNAMGEARQNWALSGLMTVFRAMLGDSNAHDYTTPEAELLFVSFTFLLVIVMLNLLIAIMGDAYSKVKQSEDMEAHKLRAQVIIEEESLLSPHKLQNKDWFPSFLEQLRPQETISSVD